MKKEDSGRRFSREFKVSVVQRMAAGANVSKLSRELGVSRKSLYQWKRQFRSGGAAVLRGSGRPKAGEEWARQRASTLKTREDVPLPTGSSDELTRALARIADLERLVGQQVVDLDFFQRALQHVGKERQQNGAPGGTASTRSSKR